ncbi:TetR/AcrR family transcriptional regulator [Streptomyces mobaraensis]|uniref:TetR/AcrR family transcriptional regulator n=1 Tax=Streptomyces mobaraensis TaxID=35621 RepID=UPI0033E69CC9
MTARSPRADAVRNREAVLAAADALFARSESPRSVSMDDIAAAAGVGKGTLFRRFGDRTSLIKAVVEARTGALREAVEAGPPPLGPGTPPRDRVPALLDAVLRFKLDHRHLALALEEAGAGSPYAVAHYGWWHDVLTDALRRLSVGAGDDDVSFTAHALLAAVRADLVEHLVGERGQDPERLRAALAAHVRRLLGD